MHFTCTYRKWNDISKFWIEICMIRAAAYLLKQSKLYRGSTISFCIDLCWLFWPVSQFTHDWKIKVYPVLSKHLQCRKGRFTDPPSVSIIFITNTLPRSLAVWQKALEVLAHTLLLETGPISQSARSQFILDLRTALFQKKKYRFFLIARTPPVINISIDIQWPILQYQSKSGQKSPNSIL